ncbi:MAG TPA: hypothetical protein VEX41_09795 [Candidatus Eisenbacteria bacterium]|nr:hypothetical protein [Candidatus Eisenbacteria bacterium]
MTGLARERIARGGPLARGGPRVALGGRERSVRPPLAAPHVTDNAAPMPGPSMRGLEATIAIAALVSAILLGFVR